MNIEFFYDPRTSTLTDCVHDPVRRDAVVIDPVLDYDLPFRTMPLIDSCNRLPMIDTAAKTDFANLFAL